MVVVVRCVLFEKSSRNGRQTDWSYSFNFMYLGILVGANQGSTSTWTNVIDAMARRLAPWSRKHISFGENSSFSR
ncbi:hypothetical protein Lal_00024361 [Lupinus albus]|nr:hypothetical protein Lal_00024361 [Lupinus albus]